MVKLRLAEERDLKKISEMYVENWKATYVGLVNQDFLDSLNVPDTIKKWKTHIEKDNHGIYVAEKDKRIMGFAAFRPEPNIDDCLYLDSLHVSKCSRKLGIGSILINQIAKRSEECGYSKMNISIVSGNERARRLYINNGAVHYEFEKIEFGGIASNVEYLMWHTLESFKQKCV